MRYIDNSLLEDSLPQEWMDRAEAALGELRCAAGVEERTSIMRQRSNVWRELKDTLASLSREKCWYCETPRLRSDDAVDHFRPKGNVAEAPSHEGYWWLAFDHRNYRLACTFCNSRRHGVDTAGGKADHFPLVDENARALCEGHNLEGEQPILLDPTDPADPGLLWFEPDGRAVPKYDEIENRWYHVRADTSIGLYHLNESKTRTRRRDNHRDLLQIIREAANHLSTSQKGRVESMKSVSLAFGRIRDMVKPSAEYSAAAKATLLAYRHEYPWIDQILSTT